jgi:hypothetical protein
MRPSVFLALAFALWGCGGADSAKQDSVAASAAADTASSRSSCLYPTTHPFNGVSQVFTLDEPPTDAADAAAPDALVTRSTGFYWHGLLITLSQATDSWRVTETSAVDGLHVHASSSSNDVIVELTAPQDSFGDRTGVVRIRPRLGDGAEEVVPIAQVRTCPERGTPSP